jgi:oxygen-independent coproporphyrinogen-3 oxidase
VRWWNVKHPVAYADRIAAGVSPAHARELLSEEDRHVERVLLELRLETGLALDVLDDAGRAAVPDLVGRDLVTVQRDRLVLTQQGRLLADGVVRDLLG